MARYIDADAFKRELIIEAYLIPAKKKKKLDFPSLVGRVLDEMPTADVAPKSEVAREIFEEIYEDCFDQFGYIDYEKLAELKKKYTGEQT